MNSPMNIKSYKELSGKKFIWKKIGIIKNFFKENKNDLIKVWQNIKNLINFNPKAKNINVKSLYIGGEKFLQIRKK